MNLNKKANDIRITTLELIKYGKTGHLGSDFSCTDILVTLYYDIMNINSENPKDENRDRYVQSKGHAAEVLWAILEDKGFINREELFTFSQYNSRIIGHPNNKVPGIEMNTGSLGHGLSISVGMALAAKMDNKTYQTYTLMGDGELAEGSVLEGAMAAAHYNLDNLTAIIDYNQLQISGKTSDVMSNGPIEEKWRAFGWEVISVKDGNDIVQLQDALKKERIKDKPRLIVAYTTKGKGISLAENQVGWHHRVPSDEEYTICMEELKGRVYDCE